MAFRDGDQIHLTPRKQVAFQIEILPGPMVKESSPTQCVSCQAPLPVVRYLGFAGLMVGEKGQANLFSLM